MKKLFSKSPSKKFLKKPAADWEREDVCKWLAYLGFSKYEEAFKAVTGRRLLQLEAADLYQLVDSKLDADLLLDAISDLKTGDQGKSSKKSLKRTSSSASAKPPLASPGSSTVPAKTEGNGLSVRTGPASDASNNSPKVVPSQASGSASGGSGTPAAAASQHSSPARVNGSSQDDALAALAPHVGGAEVVGELYNYMNVIGIQGIGLVEATQRAPIVGHIIGALWEGHDLVQQALGNRINCSQLGAYGQDILRVFDAEGKRLAFIDSAALSQLLQHVETGNGLVDSCCKPGWLVRMATNERSMEEFQAVHNIILETLRAEKVDTLPNGRQLTYGEYRDVGRPLRRMLKQFGSGSLERGLQHLRSSESALEEVSTLIHVSTADVVADLQHDQRHNVQAGTQAAQHWGTPMMTESRKRECENIFNQYDKNRSKALEFEELRSVLADLGMLDGVKPIDLDATTTAHFAKADVDGDGRITFPDFLAFYSTLAASQARQELRAAFGPQAERDLKKIFCSFASFGSRQQLDELDGAKFSKLCRDCKLLGRNLTTIDVDLIFASSKPQGQRKVDFDQFLLALSKMADKRGQSLAEVVRGILLAGGPTVNSTKASYIKFHDDKSTYTGVHAHGGPTTVDPSKDLSALLDRSESDVRGVKRPDSGSVRASLATPPTMPSPGAGVRSSGVHTARMSPNISPEGSSLGGSYRGSPNATPAGTPTCRSAASPFAPNTPSPAPSSNGHGGASTPSPAPSASSAKGVRSSVANLPLHRLALSSTAADADRSPLPTARASARENDSGSGNKAARAASTQPALDWEEDNLLKREVLEVFTAFAMYGSGSVGATTPRNTAAVELDGSRFAKLCREAGLLGGRLNATAVDLVFSKVKGKGARKIGWTAFEKALVLLADERKADPLTVARAVAACQGPRNNATTAAVRVRLHDDKSTYTGVYAKGGPSTVDQRLTMESLIDRDNTPGAAKRLVH
ncbi:hypothetical protein WJX73_000223 [Symbiochloris irregularis]|uniref:Calmodulin n=1 Tax=Symbiochloris irregularis TaxID=706552 RepID=A0AAW1PPL4_9CHLO